MTSTVNEIREPAANADAFIDHFGIRSGARSEDLLREVSRALEAFPYENLSKLIKKHRLPPGPQRRRLPGEVLEDHIRLGAGGTCFALTHLLRGVLERLGLDAFTVLCDTRHQRANHCAVVVVIDDRPLLVDPGYLLYEPLALEHLQQESPRPGDHAARPGTRLVTNQEDGRSADLFTFDTWRYQVRLEPVPIERFLQVWDASFEWTMMNGVHLCMRSGPGYLYVNGIKLNIRGEDRGESINIRDREAEVLSRQLGIDPRLIAEGYALMRSARVEGRASSATARP
jgi:arylamine N-acetyltransferase